MYKDITLDSIVDIFIRYFYSVSVRYTESLSNVTCQVDAIVHVQSLSLLYSIYTLLLLYIYYIIIYIIYLYIFNYIFRSWEVRWCMHMHNRIDLTCDIWHFSLKTGASFLQTGATEAVDQSSLMTKVSHHLRPKPVFTYAWDQSSLMTDICHPYDQRISCDTMLL